ncbi:hypothetical protein [Domibacillus enclensis]|uniref:Uncharacterized protein n=1 Tax=Domibacillus enclensis TaxID=1017273 RepID=A0A1N6XU86_9BACI|nr:hypothetical protein [Domibacillus enclensis]OXS77429.1 hypothetical protein B1B05_11340 [Domibacillus enclensis]SIR05769.1 hypothetical protein SAMN05443094_10554 [Domibacillus enclensis]
MDRNRCFDGRKNGGMTGIAASLTGFLVFQSSDTGFRSIQQKIRSTTTKPIQREADGLYYYNL